MIFKFLKKAKPRYYWLTGILLCMVILFTSIASRKSGIVESVKIHIKPLGEGELMVLEKDIMNTVETKYGSAIAGLAIRELDIKKIESIANQNPFVKDAEAYIDARSNLCINLKQNNPILKIQDKYDHSYYLDEDLKYFPNSRHCSPRILIASGNIAPYDSLMVAQGKHQINQLISITKEISSNQFAQSNIEQLYVDDNNDVILVPKIGSQKFIIGNADRIEEKLEYIRIFYKNIAPKEGWTKYQYVNLKFDGQIVCN